MPGLAILASIAGALLIAGTGERHRNLREFWSVGAGVLQFVCVASMIPDVLAGRTPELVLFRILPGIQFAFRVDALGLLFALGASLLWIATSFYSIGYMRSLGEHAQTRYFACFALALSATIGVAFSANLFTLFLFYEALTLTTYPLVAHKETDEAKAGGRKYVIYLLGAAKLLLLAAIVVTYNVAGTLEFRKGGIFPASELTAHPMLLSAVFALFLFGLAKNAVMPLHSWLPAAMVAPTPVSALLHAVAVVKTGVFSTVRVFLFVFGADAMRQLGVDKFALAVASLTILVASLVALAQDNLKLRLAFSTISQLSYIVLGSALLTSSGVIGGIAHITTRQDIQIHWVPLEDSKVGIMVMSTDPERVRNSRMVDNVFPRSKVVYKATTVVNFAGGKCVFVGTDEAKGFTFTADQRNAIFAQIAVAVSRLSMKRLGSTERHVTIVTGLPVAEILP